MTALRSILIGVPALRLVEQLENAHDPTAVAVWNDDGDDRGWYLPRVKEE